MSKKLSNLDDEVRKNIENELDSASQEMGMTAYESYGVTDNLLKEQIGLCADCKSFNYCKSEFGNVIATCGEFNVKLSGQNRIVECNLHSPKRALTLNEMYSIAYLIDPKEEKIEGFITNNKRYRK